MARRPITEEARLRYRAADRASYARDPERQARAVARTHAHRLARPEKQAWYYYRKNAQRAGREFNLDRRLFEDLVTDVCFYCGDPPSPVNGVDRVDNTRGYTEDNVVSCCRECNSAKRNRTRVEFEQWARRIAVIAALV